MTRLNDRIDRAVALIRSQTAVQPRLAIVLGTGLGNLVDAFAERQEIAYSALPGFPITTAMGHRGRFVFGVLDGAPLVAMNGRFHLYEGHSVADVVSGVRVMNRLGAHSLIVTNASGGLNPRLSSGDIVVIRSHINLLGKRFNAAQCEAKYPDAKCSEGSHGLWETIANPYDTRLSEHAMRGARLSGATAVEGTYVAVSGPNYETRAEYRFFRRIGGDVVGMSSVPEVVTANSLGQRVLGLSIVTNVANPDAPSKTTGQEVIDLAQLASTKLCAIVRFVIGHEFC